MKKISPRRTRAYAAATTLAVVLVAAACGGDNNADPPATSAPVPNTTPSTILPPPTDPDPTTTAPAPTTTPTVPTPPTTTELSEEDQAKQAVIEAAENAWYVFNEAKLDPTNEAKVELALAAFTGNARSWVQHALDDYRTKNRKSITSSDFPATARVYESTVDVDLETGRASVEMCNLGSNLTVEVGANNDGSDRVLDDSVTAYHELNTFELVDGAWLYSDGTDVAQFPGAFTCDTTG